MTVDLFKLSVDLAGYLYNHGIDAAVVVGMQAIIQTRHQEATEKRRAGDRERQRRSRANRRGDVTVTPRDTPLMVPLPPKPPLIPLNPPAGIEVEKDARRRATPERQPLPQDWDPSEATVMVVTNEIGLPMEELNHAISDFQDWAWSEGIESSDWDARFRRYCRKRVDEGWYHKGIRPLEEDTYDHQRSQRHSAAEAWLEADGDLETLRLLNLFLEDDDAFKRAFNRASPAARQRIDDLRRYIHYGAWPSREAYEREVAHERARKERAVQQARTEAKPDDGSFEADIEEAIRRAVAKCPTPEDAALVEQAIRRAAQQAQALF